MRSKRLNVGWKVLLFIFPVILGGIGGFLYYNFIGCNGNCAITGSPLISTLYGVGIGAILVNWKSGINSMREYKNILGKEGDR